MVLETDEGILADGQFFRNPAHIYAEEKAKPVVEPDATGSKIVEFYKGKTIFLTGATGFLGKMLLEKLLRSCPDLESIIVICREKKGKDLHTRMDEVFNDVLYQRLSNINPKFRHKVTILKGDISEPELGMSKEDRKFVASKTNIIIHSAATVRFHEFIKTSVEINVVGTQQMLQLASECAKLSSFVYVSTAFSQCTSKTIDEKFYPTPIQPRELIDLVRTKTDKELQEMTPSILGEWPNTYTFTKAITETLIQQESGKLPTAIVRPSIILSTYNEPMRGWVDNLYGPTGAILAAGVGLLRVLPVNGDNITDLVPVDFVANAIISVGYKRSITKFEEIPIYNYVSSPQSEITWRQFTRYNELYGIQTPTVTQVWYYNLTLTSNKLLYLLQILVLHLIPAIIIDSAAFLIGKKPRLLKIYKKIHKFCSVIAYFGLHEWTFSNLKVQWLWNDLSPADKIVFPFNADDICWHHHTQMNIMGLRTYYIKDDPSTISSVMPRWKRLKLLDTVVRNFFLFLGLGLGLRLLYGLVMTMFSFL